MHQSFITLLGFDWAFQDWNWVNCSVSSKSCKRNYWIRNLCLNCFHEMDNVQYQIMHSCHTCNYQYLFCGTYRESGCCRYFDPLILISNQNKHHLHSRLPGFLLSLHCTEDVVQAYWEDRDFRNQLLWCGASDKDNNLCVRFKTIGDSSNVIKYV